MSGHPRAIVIAMVWMAFWGVPFAAARAESEGAASVSLPLADYLDLQERAERLEDERAAEPEPPVAALLSQRSAIVVGTEAAEVVTTFEVELAGERLEPVALPVTGHAESAELTPREGATLDRGAGGVRLVAARPGRYRVTLRSRSALAGSASARHLSLPASPAPVTSAEIEIDADLDWRCGGTILVSERLEGARRRLELAVPRGHGAVLELRRRLDGETAARALAHAWVATVVEVGSGQVRRSDLLRYEVSRGELEAFELALPGGYVPTRLETDEGEVTWRLEAGRLWIGRDRRLAGEGYLHLRAAAAAFGGQAELPLPALVPAAGVRARYLAVSSTLAAGFEPRPAASWRRADLEDLPPGLREAVAELRPSALWRWVGGSPDASLAIHAPPPVPTRPSWVSRRQTTSLLTLDGTLLLRDHLRLRAAASSLEVVPPEGATLWSASVDGVAVRPVEEAGRLRLPLALGQVGESEVELTWVRHQAVPRGRSRWTLGAPRLEVPVLAHEWRLLLPEAHRYRVAGGDLRAVVAGEASHRRPRVRLLEPTQGGSALLGTVADEGGGALPGVTLTLLALGGGGERTVVSDAHGGFRFAAVAPGSYRLRAELDGFSSAETSVRIPAERTVRVDLALHLAEVVEEIVVTSAMDTWEPSRLEQARWRAKLERQRKAEEERRATRRELEGLERGLLGGVRPLEVEIPEEGKLLLLSAALPPAAPKVELEVRAGR